MNTMIQKLQSNVFSNNVYAAGVGLSALVTYVPFAASFSLARCAHLTAAAYNGSGTMVALLGVIAAVASGLAIYHTRKSVKTMLILAAAMFVTFGVLVSLIV